MEVPAMTASSPALLTDDRSDGLRRVLSFAPFFVVVHDLSIRSEPGTTRVTSVAEPDADLNACVVAMLPVRPEAHHVRPYLVLRPYRDAQREAVRVGDAVGDGDEEARLRGNHHSGGDRDADLIVGRRAPHRYGRRLVPDRRLALPCRATVRDRRGTID